MNSLEESKSDVALVHQESLKELVTSALLAEKEKIAQYERLIPLTTEASLLKELKAKLANSLEVAVALQAGYVPVAKVYAFKIDTKSKWAKKEVQTVLKTMPEDIKEAWKRAEDLGVFKSFKVTGSRQGDPCIVATAGKQDFLLGFWWNFPGGISIGLRLMPKGGK
jgi:hypothetical protein